MEKNSKGEAVSRAAGYALVVVASAFFQIATAQTPPAGATPGGALPKIPEVVGPAAVPPQGFPIPPAVDRPLAVNEGERLFVGKFALEGAGDHPDQGVNLKELESLIEDLRVESEGLNKVDERGFSKEDKVQISDFIHEVVNAPDLDMNFDAYEALIDKLRAEKAERDAGMTIGQMQQIANAVTEYYRSAGFILAQAYVPAQEVQNGVVKIRVQEGVLGNVLAEGNKDYSTKVLAKPFKALLNAPVTAQSIERALLLAGDNPGLSVFGVFQPGRKVGTSDILLRVQGEKTLDGSVRTDNFGTKFTGERRVFAQINFNNPTGVGDRLTGTALRQYRPKRSIFGQIEYERPMFWPGFSVGGLFQRNPFSVGGSAVKSKLSGETTVGQLYLRQTVLRSRQRNLYARVDLKRSVSTTKQNRKDINADQLASTGAVLNFQTIDPDTNAINSGSLGLRVGLGNALGGNDKFTAAGQTQVPASRTSTSGLKPASNDFYKVTGAYSRLQLLTKTQSLLVRLEGQWTNDMLTSLEEFSVGGPTSVRAYNPSERLADSGFLASAEYTVNAPGFADVKAFKGLTWGEILRLSLFSDFAWSHINNAKVSDLQDLALSGYGVGVGFGVPGQFQTRIQWAHPFGGRIPGDLTNKGTPDRDKAHWWFDLTYQF